MAVHSAFLNNIIFYMIHKIINAKYVFSGITITEPFWSHTSLLGFCANPFHFASHIIWQVYRLHKPTEEYFTFKKSLLSLVVMLHIIELGFIPAFHPHELVKVGRAKRQLCQTKQCRSIKLTDDGDIYHSFEFPLTSVILILLLAWNFKMAV